MFRNRQRDLRRLINSFENAFSSECIADLQSYVDHGEYGLSIEMLSDWIYEEDIAIDVEQEKAILRLSTDFGVDHDYHKFIGRKPPYPDLRTPEQVAEAEIIRQPSLENVEYLARANQNLLAVKMYREITGAGLAEAVASVERMTTSDTSQNQEETKKKVKAQGSDTDQGQKKKT